MVKEKKINFLMSFIFCIKIVSFKKKNSLLIPKIFLFIYYATYMLSYLIQLRLLRSNFYHTVYNIYIIKKIATSKNELSSA